MARGTLDEPALRVTSPDSNRDLVLHYVSHSVDGNELRVTLRDISRAIDVMLKYSMDPATGILERSATIENRAATTVLVEQAESANWNLPAATHYSPHSLAGRWVGEFQLQTQKVEPGRVVLESRRGSTEHQSSPWFAIDRGEATKFDVIQKGEELLAEKTASIGVERFVMDDGWFGQSTDDHAGLGDWYVNPQKFPNGLGL